jgi:hypothetical protein
VATTMIAPASTTIPSMITNTSNCGRPTTGHQAGGVHDGVAHGMEQAGGRSIRWSRRRRKASQRSIGCPAAAARRGPAPAPWSPMIACRHRSSKRGTARRKLSSVRRRPADYNDLGIGRKRIRSADLFSDIVQQDHNRQCQQKAGEQQQPILGKSAQRRMPYKIMTAIKKISSGASRLIRYQRSGTRGGMRRPG